MNTTRMTKRELKELNITEVILLAQSGNQDAKQEVVDRNEGLIWGQVHKFKNRAKTLELADLAQYGRIGVLDALEKFDINRGCKFSTYATWWIRKYISRCIPTTDHMFRRPVNTYDKYIKVYGMTEGLTKELGREPTHKEIANKLGWTENEVIELSEIHWQALSLNCIADEDKPLILEYAIGEECTDYHEVELDMVISSLEKVLNPREKEVIEEVVYNKKPIKETAEKMRLSRQGIHLIKNRALGKLKSSMVEDLFIGESEATILECMLTRG